MTTLFVPAGPEWWGSSRLRVYWPCRYLLDADVCQFQSVEKYGLPLDTNYDTIVWQKNVNPAIIEGRQDIRHILDVCDPAWWWEPKDFRKASDLMDLVVASSPSLAEDFNEWHGSAKAICIPDRVELSHYNTQRVHKDVTPVRFIWSGFSVNRICLFAALANLERLVSNGYKIELTIYDDKPEDIWEMSDRLPLYFKRWSLATEVETMTAHDIALAPPHPGAWGKVKSNNKILTAWACGLPNTTGEDYHALEALVADWQQRETLGRVGRRDIEANWTSQQSAMEWEGILRAEPMSVRTLGL